MFTESRREFLASCALGGIAMSHLGLPNLVDAESKKRLNPVNKKAQYGLVTYNWGKDWALPELIKNCETADVLGVELRTTHRHAVERELTAIQRREVKQKFDASSVTLVGIGSDERYDNPDPKILKKAIVATQEFIKLSHDVGGSGVKVKPNSFHKNVPHEETIEQIGKSLNQLGKYASDWGQQIRLEVHGECAKLPIIKKILDIAQHPNVAICWNCNPQDLQGEGLEHNFDLVKARFGETVHIHDLINSPYPHQKFFNLLSAENYSGWLLIEEGKVPKENLVASLAEQKKLFNKMWESARASLKAK